MDTRHKIMAVEEVEDRFQDMIRAGSSLVVAKGLFDILLLEHCVRLSRVAQLGDTLIVVVYADEDSMSTVLDQKTRSELVASLTVVNAVTILRRSEAEAVANTWYPLKIVDIDVPPLPDLAQDVLRRHRSDGANR